MNSYVNIKTIIKRPALIERHNIIMPNNNMYEPKGTLSILLALCTVIL